MARKISNLEKVRRNGTTQVDAQRANILDAAEKLFLEKGLENTNMSDIAAEAGITRVSLYRYFPDLHPIAFEIEVRMLKRIAESISPGGGDLNVEVFQKSTIRMIDQFYQLRDVYRYTGMFDHLYGSAYPSEKLAAWYKEQIYALGWGLIQAPESNTDMVPDQIAMIGNCVMSFLQKMAVRGDLMAEEQGVSLDRQIDLLKEMVNVYFDHLLESNRSRFVEA